MARLKLKWITAFRDRHGHLRHYFRRPGFKRATLPGLPGSAEFMAAYQAALEGHPLPVTPRQSIGEARTIRGSVSAAVALYLGSTNFSQLADATKYERSRILNRFREAHGDKAFGALERKHVEAMLAPLSSTPHAARALLKVLRAVTITALAAGLCTADPTAGIRIKVRKTSGFTALSEDDITQFEEHWARGTRERLAFALLLYSGQRRGDVIRMGRQHIKGGQLSVRQQKTGAILTIPVHPELAEIIAASDVGNLTFLTTETGKPFSPGYFTNWFGTACRAAGLPKGLSAHGLRKAMCRRLAEAGCSANQISAISGHATLNEVSRYTKAADQKRMAVDAMGTISRTKLPTRSTKG